MNERLAPVALSLSVLVSIICAAGGSCLFASLYYGLSVMMGHTEEMALVVTRNYVFIFVFCAIYTAIFTAQKQIWQGKKVWEISLTLFLLFYLTAYLLRFWPQTPHFTPEFTVRAFLWYGGSLGFTMVVEHIGIKYDSYFKSDVSAVSLIRKLVFSLGLIPLVIPMGIAVYTGNSDYVYSAFLWGPALVIALGSFACAYVARKQKFTVILAKLVLIYYAFAWCFLLLPVLLIAEQVIGQFYLSLFTVEKWQLYVSIACFGVVSLAMLSGAAAAKLAAGKNSAN